MAEKQEITSIDKQWLLKCINTQSEALKRSRMREIPGEPIYKLRSDEIEQLERLRGKVANLP